MADHLKANNDQGTTILKEMEFNLKVTESQASIILNTLAKEPYYTIYQLVDHLQNQIKHQASDQLEKK
jgi:hypothetical protein